MTETCEGGYVAVGDDHQGPDRATCPSCGRSIRFHRITGRFARHLHTRPLTQQDRHTHVNNPPRRTPGETP